MVVYQLTSLTTLFLRFNRITQVEEDIQNLTVRISVLMRSCRGRADKTSDFHTGGPRFEPRPGGCAQGQGALSSLSSLVEETLSHLSHV